MGLSGRLVFNRALQTMFYDLAFNFLFSTNVYVYVYHVSAVPPRGQKRAFDDLELR